MGLWCVAKPKAGRGGARGASRCVIMSPARPSEGNFYNDVQPLVLEDLGLAAHIFSAGKHTTFYFFFPFPAASTVLGFILESKKIIDIFVSVK